MIAVKKRSKKINILLTIFIIILIVLPALYLYYSNIDDEEKPLYGISKKIDNKISPLTPQAVFIEMHRIRKKGIINVMINAGVNIFDTSPTIGREIQHILEGIRLGIGWNKKPIFNYKTIIDGFKWDGKLDFETWDTDYMNHIIKKSVEEEQQTVKIDFFFIEKNKKLLQTEIIESEGFKIIYDFRNGTWDGDDYFNDSDGYGHFNGTHFEMWFSIYQTDFDGDKIPYWTEVNILNTNPKIDDSKHDPDKDGISTSWEWKWGYNPFIWDNHTYLDPDRDGLQNIEEFTMEKWLANPFYQDIYIEVDEMEKAPFRLFEIKNEDGKILPRIKRSRLDGWDHVFWEESQQMLMERFNEHGITVHIDDGIMGGGGDKLPFSQNPGAHMFPEGVIAGFYKNNFSDERKGIFRYLAVIHGGGWCAPQDEKNWQDCMTVPSNQKFFESQLNMAITPRTKRIGRAIQVIHELGHSLGFNNMGGVDNSSKNFGDPPDYPWHDYVSVMNYDYFRQRYFDYSDGSHGENDFDDWSNADLTIFQKTIDDTYGIEWERKY